MWGRLSAIDYLAIAGLLFCAYMLGRGETVPPPSPVEAEKACPRGASVMLTGGAPVITCR